MEIILRLVQDFDKGDLGMAFLLEILGFVLFILVGPFLVLGAIAGEIALGIERTFNLPILGLALSCLGVFLITYDHMAPEPNHSTMQSVVVVLLNRMGQAHALGVPLPFAFAGLAAFFVVVSLVWGLRDGSSP